MSNGKAEGEDDSSIDLIKDAGNFLLKNSCNIFVKCLQNCTVAFGKTL